MIKFLLAVVSLVALVVLLPILVWAAIDITRDFYRAQHSTYPAL